MLRIIKIIRFLIIQRKNNKNHRSLPLIIIKTISLIQFYDKRLAINDNEKRLTELSTNDHEQTVSGRISRIDINGTGYLCTDLDLPKKGFHQYEDFFEA